MATGPDRVQTRPRGKICVEPSVCFTQAELDLVFEAPAASRSWKVDLEKKEKEAAAQLIRSVDKAEEQQRLTWRFGEVKRAEGCGDGSGLQNQNRWRD